MRPVKVEFQAFGPYAGHETVDFEAISGKGLFLICGKTGTGKTTILDAMTFALYGKSSGHSRDDFESMRCTNADYDTATFVKLEFENNGDYYLFERRLERKRKNLSASYNLMQRGAAGNFKVLLENAREKALNVKAEEIIGLTYEQFIQVIVLPQGKFEKFLTSNSDDKEKILTSIFGEDKWQKIAENIYASAEERRNGLKEKKNKIQNSLREENCDSLLQLDLIIAQKMGQLDELEASYASAECGKRQTQLQGLLATVKRFKDLHNAQNRLHILAAQKDECKKWETAVEEAKRANNVRDLLREESRALQECEQRQKTMTMLIRAADEKKEELFKAGEALEKHKEKISAVDEKNKLKILYEGKRHDYEELDKAGKLVEAEKQEETAAKVEELRARETMEAYVPQIKKLRDGHERLENEHKQLLDRYLAGITGEIAGQLEEGKPCPVCGSTSHPHKAIKADHSVTRAMVDQKKKAADSKYSELQKILNDQEAAKNTYEEMHSVLELKHNAVVAAQTRADAIRENLVEGIGTSAELEKLIFRLDSEIKVFQAKGTELEVKAQAAKTAYTEANAKIEPARKEAEEAEKKSATARAALKKGLTENHFNSEEEARTFLMDDEAIQSLRAQIAQYKADVHSANENVKSLEEELGGKNEPDESECNEKLKKISEEQTSYAGRKSVLLSEIERLRKKKNNLESEGEGIEDKIREADEDFAFAKNLRGDSGTGLQRYVLGVMFSSVVSAANQMLEMVHGGRYRLYRSDDKAQGTNKRGLELKVFDKNSESHEGRFVSTLSGGEKFLASLALSIGMSAVAQKSGIKIEALFIDEGFGSLDEDSIEDAMNVLKSIQEANGLVGIISHVQLLQDRIATKLKVEEAEKGSHIVQAIG